MAIADEVTRIGAPVRRWARTQKEEYSHGEDRPLGGLLGAMGTYLTLTTAGVSVPGTASRPPGGQARAAQPPQAIGSRVADGRAVVADTATDLTSQTSRSRSSRSASWVSDLAARRLTA